MLNNAKRGHFSHRKTYIKTVSLFTLAKQFIVAMTPRPHHDAHSHKLFSFSSHTIDAAHSIRNSNNGKTLARTLLSYMCVPTRQRYEKNIVNVDDDDNCMCVTKQNRITFIWLHAVSKLVGRESWYATTQTDTNSIQRPNRIIFPNYSRLYSSN